MKKMSATAMVGIALLTACTVGRINSLQPGMTMEEVKATMGTPEQVQAAPG
jgi:outer membrane protein assembly factor BamE (lipoprotein component of BamABCDE complex)